MPFMPQGQPAAQGNVAQMGRMGMGLGAMQRPALSGSAVRRGPNVSRMDPMAGQLQSAMMARNQPPPPGAPPPPNPGLGPSQPAMQNLVPGMFGNQQPMQIPDLPEMQSNGETPNPQMIQDRQNYMDEAGKMMGQGGNPMMDRRNAMMSMMSKMGQGGQFGQRPDVMPRGPMNQGPMIGNQMMKPPGNPMAARGIGPSFMGNAQPMQQMGQQPVQQQIPAPAPQRRFGGGMMGQ